MKARNPLELPDGRFVGIIKNLYCSVHLAGNSYYTGYLQRGKKPPHKNKQTDTQINKQTNGFGVKFTKATFSFPDPSQVALALRHQGRNFYTTRG